MPRADKIEYEKRIRIIQEWILEDWPYVDMVNQIVAKGWVDERQAKRYIAIARDRWNATEEENLEHKRKQAIHRLKKHKRSLQQRYHGTPSGIDAILKVEKTILELEGLFRPTRLEITGKGGAPIKTETTTNDGFDYSKLSDSALLEIANARNKSNG